jgi:hypothetical protein
MNYDHSVLNFVSATINPVLFAAGDFAVGDNDFGGGIYRLIAGWYGEGTSLPDGTAIITYVFNYISGAADLEWYDTGASCAYTDHAANFLNDTPFSTYYKNGRVDNSLPDVGPITGSSSVCKSVTGVSYSVTPVSGANSYTWTIPAGSSITGGSNTNAITVDFLNNSTSGNVTVRGEYDAGSGSTSSMAVIVSNPPAAFAGNDTTILIGTSITLHGSSGSQGSLNYHWSPESLVVNPDIQNPQTAALQSTTTFHLLVTNSVTQCQSSDDKKVTVDMPVGINDPVLPDIDIPGNSFSIYPNPAYDIVYIKSSLSSPDITQVSILTLNGILVKQINIKRNGNGEVIMLDISDIPPGFYFIAVQSELQKIIRKLIKV